MSVAFMDSFGHLATADLLYKYTSQAGSPTIVAAQGPNNQSVLRIPATSAGVTKTLSAQAAWCFGLRVRFSALPSSAETVIRLLDAGTAQCSVRLHPDGTFSVVRSTSTALTDGASALAVSTTTWYYLEWLVTVANSISADTCKLRVNGADWITVAAAQDTQSTANATANQFQFYGPGTLNFDVCDLLIQSGSGTALLGDRRVDCLFPTGAGNSAQFTPSAGANWECVDEAAPDEDTSYVQSSTVGHKDTYAMGNLSVTPASIAAVQTAITAKKTTSGARTIVPVVRSGSTDYDGSAAALGDSYQCHTEVREVDPDTSAAWTASGVNAAEVGQKVTA